MNYKCRQMDIDNTEREVESYDPDFAPDIYAYNFIQFSESGQVTFVEVFDKDETVLWEIEALSIDPLVFITKRTTLEKARAEIAQVRAEMN